MHVTRAARPSSRATGPGRSVVLLGVIAMLLVTGATGCTASGGPDELAAQFTQAWSAGDDPAAAALTDDPAAAAVKLSETRRGLEAVGVRVTVGQVRTTQGRGTASLDLRWDLGEGREWSYLGEVELRQAPDTAQRWRVHWASTVIHPQLGTGHRLVRRSVPAEPAPVIDRVGAPLLTATPVVSVLLDRLATGDLPAVTGALAATLGPIDAQITATSITDGAARTPDGQAYLVAVLRETDYLRVREAIYDLPGVRFSRGERLLAPDARFARQVLPAIRTQVADQLDGVDGWSVQARDGAGTTVADFLDVAPRSGTAVTVGLDRSVQEAAEDAVEPLGQQAVLVAVSVSTGDVLAVAQNDPADAAGALALTGRYPPGSTFKIATALAAARSGLTADTPVSCPAELTIGGRPIPNAGRFDLGTVPLIGAFARSCNTTFAQLAVDLPPDALPAAALSLGLGADYRVPALTTITGSVPASVEPVARAENGFGQGQVLASPFGMALVAATVARGAPVVPQLLRGQPTEVLLAPTAPDPAALAQVRPMMRAVITDGSAAALAGAGEVYGKTGTAEYTGDGRAHGWFVGWRGDVALAALVVDGGSSAPAVELTGRFLAALPA